MKRYAEVLNEKLKTAGNDCVGSRQTDRMAQLALTEEALLQEAADTGTFWLWAEAVRILELTAAQQLLAGMLWGYEAENGSGMSVICFRGLHREVQSWAQETVRLPEWIYEGDGRVSLSPVLYSWLSGELPVLPRGAELKLTETVRSYGLEAILADADRIFRAAEEQEEPAVLCIEGEPGSGRSFCMEQICAAGGLALLMLDGDRLQGSDRELNACVLCSRLYGAFVCVRLGREQRQELIAQLSSAFHFYGIIREEKRASAERPDGTLYTRQIGRPDRACKAEALREILGDWTEKLPEGITRQQLLGRQLPMGTYLQYLRSVRGELEAGTLRSEMVLGMAASASLNLLPATRTFEELKLPTAQYEQLRSISRMIAAREEVIGSWGFGGKFPYGNGMSVLFYGAPGTGKTMAAQVLANELGMPLYRVDLSQLISKYIGETQKNIGRIFDEAEKCDCILLFDEADAIFTRRSDVSDAQDRYSNAETAYLLQRIEQYSGVSILATNLLQNFDEAFRRRISYMVHFPMPDVKLRTQLWESIFPKETPIAAEVDGMMLAQAFELSGASIKNAALHGALLARSRGSEVRMAHILDGIRNEYGKQGKSFSSSQKELLDAFQ